MYCKKCGNLLNTGDTVCKNCGEIVVPQNNQNIEVPTGINNNTEVNNLNNQNIGGQTPEVNQNVETPNFTNNVQQMPNMNINNEVSNNNQSTVVPNNNMESSQLNMSNQTPQSSTMNQPQAMNINQPDTSMNNITNNGVAPQNDKKNNKNMFIIIVVILAIIIITLLGVILYKSLFSNNLSNNNSNTNNSTNPTTNNVNNQNNNEDNNVSPVTNSNTATYNGFEFVIPDGYVYSVEDGVFQFVNQNDRIVFRGAVMEYYSVDNIEKDADKLTSDINSMGCTVETSYKKNYEGEDWYIFECNSEGQKMYYSYVNLGENYLLNVLVVNLGSVSNDKVFTDITKIATTAKYYGSSQFSDSDKENAELKVNDLGKDLNKVLE